MVRINRALAPLAYFTLSSNAQQHHNGAFLTNEAGTHVRDIKFLDHCSSGEGTYGSGNEHHKMYTYVIDPVNEANSGCRQFDYSGQGGNRENTFRLHSVCLKCAKLHYAYNKKQGSQPAFVPPPQQNSAPDFSGFMSRTLSAENKAADTSGFSLDLSDLSDFGFSAGQEAEMSAILSGFGTEQAANPPPPPPKITSLYTKSQIQCFQPKPEAPDSTIADLPDVCRNTFQVKYFYDINRQRCTRFAFTGCFAEANESGFSKEQSGRNFFKDIKSCKPCEELDNSDVEAYEKNKEEMKKAAQMASQMTAKSAANSFARSGPAVMDLEEQKFAQQVRDMQANTIMYVENESSEIDQLLLRLMNPEENNEQLFKDLWDLRKNHHQYYTIEMGPKFEKFSKSRCKLPDQPSGYQTSHGPDSCNGVDRYTYDKNTNTCSKFKFHYCQSDKPYYFKNLFYTMPACKNLCVLSPQEIQAEADRKAAEEAAKQPTMPPALIMGRSMGGGFAGPRNTKPSDDNGIDAYKAVEFDANDPQHKKVIPWHTRYFNQTHVQKLAQMEDELLHYGQQEMGMLNPAACEQAPFQTSRDCRSISRRYSFVHNEDSSKGACKQFTYMGCGGNDNRFVTQSDCENTCVQQSGVVQEIQQLQRKIGFLKKRKHCYSRMHDSVFRIRGAGCYENLEQYTYNFNTGKCVKIVFKGCHQKTTNIFETLGECYGMCVGNQQWKDFDV